MTNSILTSKQSLFLNFAQQTKEIYTNFYLSGGTCLSAFYLQHRYSEDLDFFNEREFIAQDVSPIIKRGKKSLGYVSIDFQQSYNRNIYHLIFNKKDSLKVEFTYYPFHPVEEPKRINNLMIDSLIDIAANKLFTIYQNPRGRDYYDLYFIMQKKNWSIEYLRRVAKIKFDFHIDYLQLGAQLMEVKKMKDDPILVKKKDYQTIEEFFLNIAKSIKIKVV